MNASATSHPTDETLSSFAEGGLQAGHAEAVRAHVKGCRTCRTRVAELTQGQPVKSGPEVGATLEPASPFSSSLAEVSIPTREADPAGTPDPRTLPAGLADHPDYQILRELGRGGMGVVYLAENTLMGRREVLKVVGSHLLRRKEIQERFLREIRSAAQLHHPNIVSAYTATRAGDSIVFSMEFIEGVDLAKLVEHKGPLPVPHACNFVYQAALGLQHAHERGMVHRDIKPSNLMLARVGKKPVVKILDFGLAKMTSERGVDGGLTHEGQMLGTPHYVAPEQTINAQRADIRADIYSLGCTLYCLLSGRPPFDAPSLYELLQAHHSMDALPLRLNRPDVPAELDAVVAKMMAKDPDQRFQTPAEVAQALAAFTRKPARDPSTHAEKPEIKQDSLVSGTVSRPVEPLKTQLEARPSKPAAVQDETARAPTAPEEKSPAQSRSRSKLPLLYAGLAAAALLLIGLATAWWMLGRARPRPNPTPASATPAGLLAEAEAAIRAENWSEAVARIDLYLGSAPPDEADRALRMLRELRAATSDDEADFIVKTLSDQELQENLDREAQPLVSELETKELSVAYRDNMVRALRREQARRQAKDEKKLAGNAGLRDGESEKSRTERRADQEQSQNQDRDQGQDQVLASSLDPRDRRVAVPSPPSPSPPVTQPEPEGRAAIDEILTSPERFGGRSLVLDGLFRIGTRISQVKDDAGRAAGLSLPVARDDGRTLCAGDGKIPNQDLYFLIDGGAANQLSNVFAELKVREASRPVFRSIVRVRVETPAGGRRGPRSLVVTGLEILGACNFSGIAAGNFTDAFRVIEVTPDSFQARYGDGTEWVKRLGGEEKFVDSIRRKFREMRRRMFTNLGRADFDRAFQREMAVAQRMADAHAREIQSAIERANMGPSRGGFR